MNRGFIYKLTQKDTGLVYIGQTVNTVKNRFKKLRELAFNGGTSKLSKAIRHYGADSFAIEIILEVDEEELESLEELELLYIEKYDSIAKGLNHTTKTDDSLNKRILLDEEEVVSIYEETQSLRKVAEELGVTKDLVSDRLEKIGYNLLSREDAIRAATGTSIEVFKGGELVSKHTSKRMAAEWFVDMEIPKSNNVDSVRKGINQGVYYGYEIIEGRNRRG